MNYGSNQEKEKGLVYVVTIKNAVGVEETKMVTFDYFKGSRYLRKRGYEETDVSFHEARFTKDVVSVFDKVAYIRKVKTDVELEQ